MLTHRFIREISEHLQIKAKTISKSALNSLYEYNWPGNVRELKNIIKKAIIICDDEITVDDLDFINNSVKKKNDYINETPVEEINNLPDELEHLDFKKQVKKYSSQIEKKLISQGLNKFKGNKSNWLKC